MLTSLTWWIADFGLLFLIWMLTVQVYRGHSQGSVR